MSILDSCLQMCVGKRVVVRRSNRQLTLTMVGRHVVPDCAKGLVVCVHPDLALLVVDFGDYGINAFDPFDLEFDV